MKPFALLLVIGIGVGGVAYSRAQLVRLEGATRFEKQLLYLPNGKHLKALSLGHDSLVADVVYLWAIQYYSDYERADRFRFVEHVFGNVIAELDPHYIDPYWLGALILTIEAQDLDGGLRILDRGFERNPDQWILPYLAGWECERAGQYQRAASYFDRAARVPKAPAFTLRMRAGMIARTGDVRAALRMWDEVFRDPRSDEASRAIAERQVRDLRVRLDLSDLDAAVRAFRARTGGFPRELAQLVSERLLGTIPLDPDGNAYEYDRDSGRVSTKAARLLGDR